MKYSTRSTRSIQHTAIQVNIPRLHHSINLLVSRSRKLKAVAKVAHRQRLFSFWSKLMNRIKAIKRQLLILVNMLHRKLYYAHQTAIPFNYVPYTTADILAAITYATNYQRDYQNTLR